MADYIPVSRPMKANIQTPLTPTQLQLYVGGFIHFIELSSGDIMVVNEASHLAPLNPTASSLAGRAGPIHGDVILCSPQEIA